MLSRVVLSRVVPLPIASHAFTCPAFTCLAIAFNSRCCSTVQENAHCKKRLSFDGKKVIGAIGQ